jgi:asparagine synthase (glutamine-hydrolysing)
MCGVFGWVLPMARRRDEALLRDLTDKLAHRGPDGSGVWLGETANQSHQIGLGHRRLAILDLSEAGAQPMRGAGGNTVVTFNGEIYNYLELRDELAAHGHVFTTGTDTEVLLAAYAQWGSGCITRFRGMFALVLWDAGRQELLFARDAFGKKPLYLGEVDGGLLFSSEIAPLLAFPGMGRRFNHAALPHYLLNRYVPSPQTFFQGITKLAPGCTTTWKNGGLTVQRYFTPPVPEAAHRITSFEEGTERFAALLDESVAIRMRSDAPYGAFLSGGIDSSAIVATMAEHSSGPIRTFSAGFREKKYSELDAARDISRHFGTNHEELVVEPEMFFAELENAIDHRGCPPSETSDLVIAMLSRQAFRSVRMVLTGEGSDELLGGYPKYRIEPLIDSWQALLPLLRPVAGLLSGALPYSMRRAQVALRALGEPDADTRLRVWFGGTSTRECRSLLGDAPAPADPFPFSAHSGSRLRDMLFFDQTSYLPDNLLERGDRMMMMGSIEGRMPFLDTELARLVSRFPDQFLIGDGVTKRVLRQAMAAKLPPYILERKKIGFLVPIGEWFRSDYRGLLGDLLGSGESRVARLLHGAKLRLLVAEHLSGRKNHSRLLWSLLGLELFLRRFAVDIDSPAPAGHG